MNINAKILTLLVCSIAVFGRFLSPAALAEDYEGVVVGQDVYVRAAPSMNSDRLTKLNEPQRVTVTDTVDDWLAILPAPGCYSVISKQYVDLNPETKIGTVTGDGVNVRAAGTLKTNNFFVSQGRLNRGDTVRVIGNARDANGEWYVIKPPSMVKFYISSRYVKNAADYDRDKQAQPEETATTQPEQTPSEVTESVTIEETPAPAAPKEIQPVRKEMQTLQSIRKLEKDMMAESKKPVNERDFQKIMEEAEKLDVPQSSRFRPVYDSLLSFAKEEVELARQRQAASMLVSEALNPTAPVVAEEPQAKKTPAGYDLQGILEVSELYSAGPGGQRFVVRDPSTFRIHGYAQNTTGSVNLRRYVGKNVGLRGKAVLDKKLSLSIFEIDNVDVIGETESAVVETIQPEPEPATPQPTPELVIEPAPAVSKPAPVTPQPWSSDMIEPTPLVAPMPVEPAPVEIEPAPVEPPLEPVVTPEPVKPVMPEPIEPAPIELEPTPIEKPIEPVVPEPVKPVMPEPIEPAPVELEPTPIEKPIEPVVPEPVKPVMPEPTEPAPIELEPTPIEKPIEPVVPEPVKPVMPEPTEPVIPAPVEKPEPIAPAPIELEPTPVKPIAPVAKPAEPGSVEPPRPEPIKISPIPVKPEPMEFPAGKPQPIRPAPIKIDQPTSPAEVSPASKPAPVKIAPMAPAIIKPAAATPTEQPVKEQLIEVEWD